MLDERLRPAKDRVLAPLTTGVLAEVPPLALSLTALAATSVTTASRPC